MIVKNEQDFLPITLESVQGLVDEIIICDTGSSDRSKEIALAFGAKVFDIPFNNNFSEARNEALMKASGEWILVLDGDEALDQRQLPEIKKLLSGPKECYYFQRYHYTNDHTIIAFKPIAQADCPWELDALGFTSTIDIRLFPNDSRIRYGGIIHEAIETSIQACGAWQPKETPFLIHHFGQLKTLDQQREKFKLYTELSMLKWLNSPLNYRQAYELGVQFQQNGHFQEALKLFSQAIGFDATHAPSWREAGRCLLELGQPLEASLNLGQSVNLEPTDFTAWNMLGLAFLRSGRIDEAVRCLQITIKAMPHNPTAWFNLAEAHNANGNIEEARRAYNSVLSCVPEHRQAIERLSQLPDSVS